MNPVTTQQVSEQAQTDFGGLQPDQIAAALSFATFQGEQFLPAQQPQMMEEPMMGDEDTQQEPTKEEPKEEPEEEKNPAEEITKELDVKLEGMKAELKQEIKNELGELTKTLKDALK